ncbi:HET-domain-containing protein [Lepidopterella palustris CBS 459.81]|uniref:HET-domain-containing protein n=1 Tax=Lepidopterella palustris CBS 459.81 TaxID=1314670 RepID=A0A8E2E0G6_9PEZI|nr:HET-domain-containing protein [Lepidopterella palustris CBS 459.81]
MTERGTSSSKTSAICPVCNLLPLHKLNTENPDLYIFPVSLVLEELDFNSVEQFGPQCDLCRLLVALRTHWLSEERDRPLAYDGTLYWSPCGRSQPRLRYTDHSYLGLCVDFDSILAKCIERRHADTDPLSDRSSRLVKYWMSKCERKHSACFRVNAPLPTRVIDVGDATSETLRLVETEEMGDKVGKYAALSHCWGTCRAFLTQRANLGDRKRGFTMTDLPATFRDAVRVARSLGIQYLWIDSLCILQDDLNDWEIESAKMAGVYENATLVVAAVNAADDGEGFLKERKRHYLPVNIRSASGRMARIFIQPAVTRDTSYPPLHNRAWTLQESYLGTRKIFFNSFDLQWECRQAMWYELGKENRRVGNSLQDVLPKRLENGGISYHGWYVTVQNYTARAITYESDKFPALSALAQRVAQHSKDTYLAGIWERDIARGLLWCREVRRKFRRNESSAPFSNTGRKPQRAVYLAPSWSWASFPGAIGFQSADPSTVNIEILPCLEFIGSKVEVPGKNPFGAVGSCSITLRAPLLSLEYNGDWGGIMANSESAANRSWCHNLVFCPELQDIDIGVVSSFDYPEEPKGQLRALPLALSCCETGHFYEMEKYDCKETEAHKVWHKVHGVIISTHEGQPTSYERVGCFTIWPIEISVFKSILEGVGSHVVRLV